MQVGSSGQDDRTLDEIFELTDITRPVILGKHQHGFRRYRLDPLVHASGMFLSEVAHEQRNVVRPIPQGRHNKGKHVEPVIEIAPELFVANHSGQIPIRCGYQTEIYADGTGASQPLEFMFL